LLRPVINASGVVLHTDRDRRPQSAASQEALSAVSGDTANFEFDLSTGPLRSSPVYVIEGALLDGFGDMRRFERLLCLKVRDRP
jgi:seryl-tRNA(Sec) selenium transferase